VPVLEKTIQSVQIAPFVKWAGGKRQLLNDIRLRLPKGFNRYFEPFIGGGALLFALQPKIAFINDINSELVNAYKQIRDNSQSVIAELQKIDRESKNNPKEYYYLSRELFNNRIANKVYDAGTAALFIYINKHCFNGLYRVNAKGGFNVPFNNSKQDSFTVENLLGVSKFLKQVKITNLDFADACNEAKDGDFIFFDSPYAPLNPTSFESYTKEGFTVEDHERLAKLYRGLTDRGCYCMLTNHNTEFINNLYEGFTIDVIQVRRSINSDASKRTGEETIIRNY
jgi:DNA adenine methylase